MPNIRPASPSYPSYYKSSLSKTDNEKISYLTECLKEKEEELALLNKCLEEKENELNAIKNKNNQKTKINNIRKVNNKNIDENKLFEQIESYEYEIERKNKEIILLKKRIKNLLIYLKKKDNNILILDNELRMYEKENEEIKIDHNNLIKENQRLEDININLLANNLCICDTGISKCNHNKQPDEINKYYLEQKKETQNLRNRYNALFKDLEEYRKKNDELSNELKNLKEDWKFTNQ